MIYADKICVDEETVRLRSHIENTRQELLSGESVGRKLDFIAQEMNREANTILSKSSDLAISDKAIALKTEIEKVREQILAIRDTGLTNMFDVNMVQRLAYERDFYELVLFLEDHRKEYVNFILHGDE